MKKNKLLIFTATYNEKDNIESLCRAIFDNSPDCDLLIVDDNSPDGTGEILEDMRILDNRIFVIHRSGKLGLGSAHKLGMNYAIEHEYDILITMDADFSHDPKDISRLTQEICNVDFVIGSRYMDGGGTNYLGYRKHVSSIGNWTARLLLGISVHELTTSYRAFRVPMLAKLNLKQIKSEGYSFFLESLFWINFYKFKISEIPIIFRDRAAGLSKIPKLQIVYGVLTLIRLILIRFFKINRKL
ncbi:MAG: polyprenol monophosphomannose synthase [Spirochaetota bacterium]|nr:polyprenol monophosphomannose synthase [Spirochaetota bacterium]